MSGRCRAIFGKFRFYGIKLPLILVLICLGYLLDFLVQLPFAVMCSAAPDIRPRAFKDDPGFDEKVRIVKICRS